MNLAVIAIAFVAFAPVAMGIDTRDFKEFIDTTLNPCENFYEYTCGKWTPKNINSTDVLSDLMQENRNVFKDHFTTLKQKGIQDKSPTSKFFYLCLDSWSDTDEEILTKYLRPIMEFSEWPYINQTFNSSAFDWLQVAAKLRRHQIDTLFGVSIHRNWKSSGQNVIQLASLKKPWDDEDKQNAYKKTLETHLNKFGVQSQKSISIAEEVVGFITELASLDEDVEEAPAKPISLEKFIDAFPKLALERYFETLLGKSINRSQPIVVQLELFKKMEALFLKTKPDIIALYQLTRYIPDYDAGPSPVHWINCIDELNTKMPLSVASDFEDISSSNDFTVWETYYRIQQKFIEDIENTDKYDAKAKEKIIDKLELLRLILGISDPAIMLEPEEQIDQKYYQQARMAFAELAATNEFDQLYYDVNVASKIINPLNVNAFYVISKNALEVPIGLLQLPVYRNGSFKAHVMGSIGSMLSRELVRGMELYDSKGNVTVDTNAKAKCSMKQCSDEVSTLNEDVIESEGLRLLYEAFDKIIYVEVDIDPAFSVEQHFFISYAQSLCQVKNSSSKQPNKNYSVYKERVNNVVADYDPFLKAFSCGKYEKQYTKQSSGGSRSSS